MTSDRAALRVLTFNMQVGLASRGYLDYVTGAWRHALPGPGRLRNLETIASAIRDFDFVAVQEADAGSLRTGFRNHLEWLAGQADFPYHGHCITRDLRPVARHSLGFLSRVPVRIVGDHALPGAIPGRRALEVEVPLGAGPLRIFVVHLALGAGSRGRQLEHLAARVPVDRPCIVMGDFNCEAPALDGLPTLKRLGLRTGGAAIPTFPSWRPRRAIDHMLVTSDLQLVELRALPALGSDHLPLAGRIARRAAAP